VTPRVLHELPRPIREIENVFIPLRDGVRLAARLWLPADADTRPVPALLEAIPYRKRDFMRLRDEPMHRYFAGHGYAAIRLDLRGSGDSDGLLDDEYPPQEQQDILEVIEWATQQRWCNGRIGMTGISWGGFNALQVAAHAPEALQAIITLCASDDRYSDDAHYAGGCLLNENQIWGTVLFALNGMPPDPEIVGDRWRTMWKQRLENNRPFPALWLEHQRRDAYWKQGSVCEDYSRIRCPVYAIGGWADGYTNAVPRLLGGLSGPRKGLIGPWAHTFPHNGVPGPAIGYMQEAVRWWDHWLKDIDSGILDEPMLRVWMQEHVEPEPFHAMRPGRWVAEAAWPPNDRAPQRLHLGAQGTLEGSPQEDAWLRVSSPETTGMAGGDWCGFGTDGEAPLDQRGDDGRSLVFDSAVLTEPLEILGSPEMTLRLRSDRPVAMVTVRLNDVSPNGNSARVTFGILNLTHRDSHEHPEPLPIDQAVLVRVPLNAIAHRFPAGHVIRLAISTAYWPMVWPAPEFVTLTVSTAASVLSLPVRTPQPEDDGLEAFEPPEAAPSTSNQTPLAPPEFTRTVERDLTTNELMYHLISKGGDLESAAIARIEEIGLDLGHTVERHFCMEENNPLSARAMIFERLMMRRGSWQVRVRARTELTANIEEFRVRAWLEALEGEETVFQREWEEFIPRDLL